MSPEKGTREKKVSSTCKPVKASKSLILSPFLNLQKVFYAWTVKGLINLRPLSIHLPLQLSNLGSILYCQISSCYSNSTLNSIASYKFIYLEGLLNNLFRQIVILLIQHCPAKINCIPFCTFC